MDFTGWPQNPNPNPYPNPYPIADSTFWYTAEYSANHYHNLAADPYQSAAIYSHNASFSLPPQPQPQPQPQPPGVDPRHMVPPATMIYVEQTNYEAQQSAAPGSYYPDPNANWAASASLVGSALNATSVIAPLAEIQPHRANSVIQSNRRNTNKKVQKKTRVVQSAWCDVCKVDCNSVGVLDQHKLGKRHKKNLERLRMSSAVPETRVVAVPASVTAPPAAATTSHVILCPPPVVEVNHPAVGAAYTSLPGSVSVTDKPVIGPEENPDKPKPSNAKRSRRKAAAFTEDLETKRRKIVEGGAMAASVRACDICNIVCNSDTVFNFHLAGQKHASMVRKLATHAGAAASAI